MLMNSHEDWEQPVGAYVEVRCQRTEMWLSQPVEEAFQRYGHITHAPDWA